jgi:hypothetical protein
MWGYRVTDGGTRRRGPDATGARAQAFTLEAIVASVVVLGALLFALQVAGVTALTASTSTQAIQDQQGSVAAGVLDAAAAEGSLGPTLRYWDNDTERFHGVPRGVDRAFYTVGPPTAFGSLLNETLDDRDVAFNVDLRWVAADGSVGRTRLVRYGQPSDDASRATRTVTLYDDDRLLYANGTRSNVPLTNASFYAPDASPDSPVYNVVRVEVVVWRV